MRELAVSNSHVVEGTMVCEKLTILIHAPQLLPHAFCTRVFFLAYITASYHSIKISHQNQQVLWFVTFCLGTCSSMSGRGTSNAAVHSTQAPAASFESITSASSACGASPLHGLKKRGILQLQDVSAHMSPSGFPQHQTCKVVLFMSAAVWAVFPASCVVGSFHVPSWWLSWAREGSSTVQLPSGVHCNTSDWIDQGCQLFQRLPKVTSSLLTFL